MENVQVNNHEWLLHSSAQGTWLANQVYLTFLKSRAEADVHHNANVISRPVGPVWNISPTSDPQCLGDQ